MKQPSWDKDAHRCHHPLRLGNRLYTSYWKGGFVILDIDDMTSPKLVSGLDWSPPFACPTHTALPLPFEIRGRRYWSSPTRTCSAASTRCRPSSGWSISRTSAARCRSAASRSRASRANRHPHDGLPSALREGDGYARSRSPGSPTACASSMSKQSARAARGRLTSFPTCRRAPTGCRATISPSTSGGSSISSTAGVG